MHDFPPVCCVQGFLLVGVYTIQKERKNHKTTEMVDARGYPPTRHSYFEISGRPFPIFLTSFAWQFPPLFGFLGECPVPMLKIGTPLIRF